MQSPKRQLTQKEFRSQDLKQSAGILEDYDIKKDIKTISISSEADNTLSGAKYIPNVIFGTDVTPPTASNYPIGTIYVQYTP